MHSGCFTLEPVNESVTMCYLIYRVNFEYICLLNSDLSRHAMSAMSLRYIRVVSLFDQLINPTLCVS